MPIVPVLTGVFVCAFINKLQKGVAISFDISYSIDTGKGQQVKQPATYKTF